jgi:hypothetical protein
MRNPRNLLVLASVCLALGACSDAPTVVKAASGPSFQGGHVFGSGARSDSTTTTTATSTETTATDSSTAADGGHVLGSGA